MVTAGFLNSYCQRNKQSKMDCNKFQARIIFLHDEELTENEKKEMMEHMKGCADCTMAFAALSEALSILAQEKEILPNPYLFSKIKTRLNSASPDKRPTKTVFARLQPTIFILLLIISVYTGTSLGHSFSKQIEIQSYTDEIALYINEMQTEPLENFLLEQ
ncbi:MAG TPA: hypothetical protein DCY35_01335 [Prolixibacteraceae bacterium]|nr:hypothetical protein [Prolixibacteraceae bacterium]